jgi:hypothetical protein
MRVSITNGQREAVIEISADAGHPKGDRKEI